MFNISATPGRNFLKTGSNQVLEKLIRLVCRSIRPHHRVRAGSCTTFTFCCLCKYQLLLLQYLLLNLTSCILSVQYNKTLNAHFRVEVDVCRWLVMTDPSWLMKYKNRWYQSASHELILQHLINLHAAFKYSQFCLSAVSLFTTTSLSLSLPPFLPFIPSFLLSSC